MKISKTLRDMRSFLILTITQGFSTLGSGMTSYALIIWSYQQKGSALGTALLSVCSYAPYVLMSILAGALTDRWDKKRTLLVCDSLAAVSTIVVLLLLKCNALEVWHLYVLNAFNGLMNTVQSPASDVTVTLLTPKEHYQQVSAVQSFLGSINSLLTPALATAVLTLAGLDAVIAVDLATFAVAFLSLMGMKIPQPPERKDEAQSVLSEAKAGLRWLRKNQGILHLIFFLSAINLTASMYNAALPALLLPRENGESMLGVINTVTGVAMLLGSLMATLWPKPKSHVRVICNTLTISMCTENLFLALGKSLPVWCAGSLLGWTVIPLMNVSMSVVMRSAIPVDMQGRVWAARNTLQFFTIPVGYLLGGALVDSLFEPLMASQAPNSLLTNLFGMGKGSGAAALFLMLWIMGAATCFIFRRDKQIKLLENDTET